MKRQEELKKKIVKIVHAFCITCTCMDTAPTLEQAQTFPSYTPFVLGLWCPISILEERKHF